MPITTALCTSFKSECQQGIHSATDTYKCAVIKAGAAGTFGAATTNYSQLGSDEASGTGYTAGGITLAAPTFTTSGTTAMMDFADPAALANATLSGDGVLIYNSSKSNRAVYVGAFPATVTSTGGSFQIDLPASGAGSSLIRF